MNQHTVWTSYYGPREFYRAFRAHFDLTHYRALCLLTPPPYLTWLRERHGRWYQRLLRVDQQVAGWPLLRGCGDHFLMLMTKH
jgi:hypothetical protein